MFYQLFLSMCVRVMLNVRILDTRPPPPDMNWQLCEIMNKLNLSVKAS